MNTKIMDMDELAKRAKQLRASGKNSSPRMAVLICSMWVMCVTCKLRVRSVIY